MSQKSAPLLGPHPKPYPHSCLCFRADYLRPTFLYSAAICAAARGNVSARAVWHDKMQEPRSHIHEPAAAQAETRCVKNSFLKSMPKTNITKTVYHVNHFEDLLCGNSRAGIHWEESNHSMCQLRLAQAFHLLCWHYGRLEHLSQKWIFHVIFRESETV